MRRDIGPLAPIRFFMALRPHAQLAFVGLGALFSVLEWGLGRGMVESPRDPSPITFLGLAVYFSLGLAIYFSDAFREKVIRPDVDLEALTGPWWMMTGLSGMMALVVGLKLLGLA